MELWQSTQAQDLYANTNASVTEDPDAPISIEFVPLKHANSDYIVSRGTAAVEGTYELFVTYAMSSSQANDVALRMDYIILTPGDTPSTKTWTVGTADVITQTSDQHSRNADSSIASHFVVPGIKRGDRVMILLQRVTTSDTHTGDMRVIATELIQK
jgi:hypothetical protein